MCLHRSRERCMRIVPPSSRPRVFDVRLEFVVLLRIKITRNPQPENYVTSTWPPALYQGSMGRPRRGSANLIFVLHTGHVSFLSSIIHFLRHASQHQCMHGWMLNQATELCAK